MKINFNKIIQIIKKYKVMILFIVLIIILFCSSASNMEGFGNNIGEYDYLAPPPPLVLDDYTWKQFILKQIEVMSKFGGTTDDKEKQKRKEEALKLLANESELQKIKKNMTDQLNGIVSESEIQYFIQNGEYPYNKYVINYLEKANLNSVKNGGFFPNRSVYEKFIYPKESKENPLPLSAKIYLGIEKPPTYSNTMPSTNTSSSVITNDISAIKSNSYYSELVSLCKKVMKRK